MEFGGNRNGEAGTGSFVISSTVDSQEIDTQQLLNLAQINLRKKC